MALFISSLNSGSNGNCYYIGNGDEAILVDAGLSCREIERRMQRVGLSMETVRAVFISHEHSDHIRGLELLSRKYSLPVYITPSTLTESRIPLAPALVRSFVAYETVVIGSLTITPFPKTHDASDPHSFTVSGEGVHIGVFTDIGFPCAHLISQFGRCHAAFLEANYDEGMLEQGRYPIHLKRRIRGGEGHLSNAQALELFKAHRPAYMTHLLLSHLSQDNNDPALVLELFAPHAAGTHVAVASRYEPTVVYEVCGKAVAETPVASITPSRRASAMKHALATHRQGTLF
jgi:phosphoribosyl 1,2-cyclic phosphodiesterase